MTTATLEHPNDTQAALTAAFKRYHAAWEAQDPDRIADLHSSDSVFRLHDGTPAVEGRENIRRHVAGLFQQYGIGFEEHRTLFGDRRWVFDYTIVLTLTGQDGAPFTARIDMYDVVDLNAAGEVTRKEVFLDPAEAKALMAKAGLA
jgi:ketosteroid isomerase-like protein